MAMKSFLILAAIAAVSAVPHSKLSHKAEVKRPNEDFIKWYDCSDKPSGNYANPRDCTRFITCSNGNAADMACADCDQGNVLECAGNPYLVWNDTNKVCDWPKDTQCSTLPEEPTTTEEATTTEKPTTTEEPATTTPEEETTTPEEPETEPTHGPTTEKAPETTAAPVKETCEGRVEGAPCEKDDCRHCGFCLDKRSFFYRCDRIWPNDPKHNVTGVFVKGECDANLWWNPDAKPRGVEEGGACDIWGNLSEAVQEGYKNDPRCVEELCEYGQDDEDKCSANYWYHDPKVSDVREDLKCSNGLIWDPKSETCRGCYNVEGCKC